MTFNTPPPPSPKKIEGINNWLKSKDTKTSQTHNTTTFDQINFSHENFRYLSVHFLLHVYMNKNLWQPDYVYFFVKKKLVISYSRYSSLLASLRKDSRGDHKNKLLRRGLLLKGDKKKPELVGQIGELLILEVRAGGKLWKNVRMERRIADSSFGSDGSSSIHCEWRKGQEG